MAVLVVHVDGHGEGAEFADAGWEDVGFWFSGCDLGGRRGGGVNKREEKGGREERE